MTTGEYLSHLAAVLRDNDNRGLQRAIAGLLQLGFPRLDIFVFLERKIRENIPEDEWARMLTIVHDLITCMPRIKKGKKTLAPMPDMWDHFG